MNDYINVGFLSSPFGLKGEIKVLSNLNHLDKIFKVGNTLRIDNNDYIIKTYRFHKKNVFISFEAYEDINKIDSVLKKEIFIKRSAILLEDNEYLYSDIINAKVISNNKEIGIVEDIMPMEKYPIIRVGKLLIPLNEHFLEKVDIDLKIVYVNFIKELYDEN